MNDSLTVQVSVAKDERTAVAYSLGSYLCM